MLEQQYDDASGILTLSWNTPGAPVNVKSEAAIAAFADAVEQALGDAAVKGIIITSAKRDFISGGDLESLRRVANTSEASALVARIGVCLRRLERGGKPVVAAINGSALGGGYEVALACHHRIAADLSDLRIGLPESTLGLMPGAGGTQRLPRLVGIRQAADLLLEGKTVDARTALELGLVDQLVPAEQLMQSARDWLAGQPEPSQPWDRKGYRLPGWDPQSPEGRMFFMQAWPALRRRTLVDDPARGSILQALHHGCERSIDAGLQIEARLFARVASSDAAKNKIRTLFYGVNAARRLKGRPEGFAPYRPQRIGVVGAGLMGSGIAHTAALAGLDVMLVDTSLERAEQGKARIARNIAKAVERRRLSAEQGEAALARIQAVGSMQGLAGCEAVIEAVVERQQVKGEVINQAFEIAGRDILFASNTSTLPITELATLGPAPGNFIGMHFFAPVDRMPLLEIIRGHASSEATVARALDLARILRKTPIVIGDGRGFYTSRVVGSYTREALLLLEEGVPPPLVDNVALNAGMPIGPLAMADQTSLDLLFDILGSLAGDARGEEAHKRALEVLDRLAHQLARPGRKQNAGIYSYDADGSRHLWEGLAEHYPLRAAGMPDAGEVRRRLLHIQALETVQAMDDGVISAPADADVASVMGWAFPSHLGGVLSYVDNLGIQRFVDECDALAQRHGSRFLPPARLREMARDSARFHAV